MIINLLGVVVVDLSGFLDAWVTGIFGGVVFLDLLGRWFLTYLVSLSDLPCSGSWSTFWPCCRC